MMAFLAAGFLRGSGALSVLALILIAAGLWISDRGRRWPVLWWSRPLG